MSTLDTLIQHLRELREKEGKDIPLYLVDSDFMDEVRGTYSFKDFFKLGQPGSPRTYDTDKAKPRGLLLVVF